MDKCITEIVCDMSTWTDHYPTGCIMYHYGQMIDSAYCDSADEYIEYIESYKANMSKSVTEIRFIFDGFDLDNSTAIDCAKEVYEAFRNMLYDGR